MSGDDEWDGEPGEGENTDSSETDVPGSEQASMEDIPQEVEEEERVQDEVSEEEMAESVESETQDRIEKLETELTQREEEIEDLTARLKRSKADFQNYKKRMEKQQEEIRERATEKLVERLIEVRNNLARAIEQDHSDVEGIRDGVKMTLAEFDRVLDAENVARIEPSPGESVDPNRHEVMMRVESSEPEDSIANVYSPGYEMGDRVIRPAQVTVSEGNMPSAENDDSEN